MLLKTTLLFILSLIISTTNSEEDTVAHLYHPSEDDNFGDIINKHIKDLMQVSDMKWNEPKIKTESVDIRAELDKLNISYVYQPSWPDNNKKLGAVTAVCFDKDNNVVIFHRCDRIWTQSSFDNTNRYREKFKGPIPENTVVAFDRENGSVVYEWGKNLFYMPHGLTVDFENNIWITDVALHQVMKFGPKGGDEKPLMTLGNAFEPGNSNSKFCKPTAVAVLPNGDFFVADGYCNGRIIKYSKFGEVILIWGVNSFQGDAYDVAPKNYLAIPHALTLANNSELLCVADRENGRVQCFYTETGIYHSQYHNVIVGDRLFSVDYTPYGGGQLFVVNGPIAEFGRTTHYNEVRGYVFDMNTKQVLSKFGPNDLQFSNPHDIAVSDDGDEIYVAELDPNRVHKFLSKRVAKNTIYLSAAKILRSEEPSLNNNVSYKNAYPSTALILTTAAILSVFTFGIVALVIQRSKRGCTAFEVNKRRHAWDFPVKTDGFKLGNLLDRKRGFEKLDQNASDEEVILASAQFA